eukprot:TRINITY_DN4980_c0_g1_i2.p1 TRINITY_DN4980_c0_g1~~TRINITY_DN4980_c0_g1_i2.p1  ORF type:complete len:129 (-),score=11.70 TRINITY_DN4980_c0_g1_i2:211-597(-)
MQKGLQHFDNIKSAILLGARKKIVHDQRISRESMLLLQMVAGGHQLRSHAFELKRAAADVEEASDALFQSRQVCIEACKNAYEASERPPEGFWEANWEHFARLERAQLTWLLAKSRLVDANASFRFLD